MEIYPPIQFCISVSFRRFGDLYLTKVKKVNCVRRLEIRLITYKGHTNDNRKNYVRWFTAKIQYSDINFLAPELFFILAHTVYKYE